MAYQAFDACHRPGKTDLARSRSDKEVCNPMHDTVTTQYVDADVVVIGGGSAGIAAAVGAARAGADVVLVEQYGFLGGAAANSSVLTYCGFFDQTRTQVVRGVGQLLIDKLRENDVYRTHTIPETGNTVVLLDREMTKRACDELVVGAGVRLYLHTTVIGARSDGDRVREVEAAHRGGRLVFRAPAFVDCSGDGVLLAYSAAAVTVTDPSQRQASTLVMCVGGVDEDADLSAAGMTAAVERFRATTGAELVRSSGIAARLPISREVMLLLADAHRDALDVRELTGSEIDGRRECWQYLEAFRAQLRGWSRAFLATTGPQIGIRETRRLRGRDTVTAGDVSAGRRRPEDAIARCGWPMERHVVPGLTEYGGIKDKGWYDIPYGAICAVDRNNLWAGGRLTSSDARAYASLRVMGTSFATGHACGIAAALYSRSGVHDSERTRRELRDQGALI